MTFLKREAILAASDLGTTDVEVPEWGGTIRVRQMTLRERGEFAKRATGEDAAVVGAWLISAVAVDESGAPLFKPEDVKELEKRSWKALDRVVAAILKLNRLTDEAVEDAAKN